MIVDTLTQTNINCPLILGNFDGVHLGHQALIAKAQTLSSKNALLTFSPHPKEFFVDKPHTIQTTYDKLLTLKAYGIQRVIVIPFNTHCAKMGPDEFIENILKPLNPTCIVVGKDFHFGHQRAGNIHVLGQHFKTHIVEDINYHGKKVSSSACRDYLSTGDIPMVSQLIGRPFHASGIVRHGQHLGRKLGYPTANIHAKHYLLSGIFAGYVILPNRRFHIAAISIGHRPMAPLNHGIMEAHLLDFDGDLYGQRLNVVFCKKIRDQIKLSDFEELKTQMHKDTQNIRTFFKHAKYSFLV